MNRLAQEQSPYLLQHSNNPVDWYPWGSEAFEAARRQDRPIFLSVGYSTCYWCHVMEHDSFEQAEVAELLSRYFICIKVDREERPDVDAIYMDAIVGLTGHGGWPLSVFLTPQLTPIWGGTFFRRPEFMRIVESLGRAWLTRRPEIEAAARDLTAILQSGPTRSMSPLADTLVKGAVNELRNRFDPVWGGFGEAPKFPPCSQIELLLDFAACAEAESRERVLSMVRTTLNAMIGGGIYDHVGGGFHRYATDREWRVPHFEKMLYDNAQMAFVLLVAGQVCGEQSYFCAAEETLRYLSAEMRAPGVGFYAAQDAGEVEREGAYYLWDSAELKAVLTKEDHESLVALFQLEEHGNFEHGRNILYLRAGMRFADRERSRNAINELTEVRRRRSPVHRDCKVLSGWNGLALRAYARAASILGKSEYAEVATTLASELEESFFKGDELLRSRAGGKVRHSGCLEDYAFFIEGLLELYRMGGEVRWLRLALALQSKQDKLLWDDEAGAYRTSAAKDLIVERIELFDNATPSGNGTSLCNLATFASLYPRGDFEQRARRLSGAIAAAAERAATGVTKALTTVVAERAGPRHLVVKQGIGASPLQAEITSAHRPWVTLAYASAVADPPIASVYPKQGDIPDFEREIALVCRKERCELPTSDPGELAKLLKPDELWSGV